MMSRLRRMTRRAFVIGSVAVVGGVAFGGYHVSRAAPNPLRPGSGEAALTPFVFIDKNGVTLIAPRAEMGQGVRTTWAALIAEELDVTLEAVNVIHGPAAKAYYNAALMTGLPDYDDAPEAGRFSKVLLGKVSQMMGLQVTGGSTSMKDGFVRMRQAGATARETLKEAAAMRLGVPRAALKTEDGVVTGPDGTQLTYIELAADAARIDVITDVSLRDRSRWRYLGRSVPRVDMVEKVTGRAAYAIDIRLPGMKFAALRMNPALGGGMSGFDATEALAMAGVERVVDLDDGVAVVASNSWLAQKGAEAVRPSWGPAPYPETTEALFAEIGKAFDGEENSKLRDDGHVDQRVDGAEEISVEYRVPYLAHATMEPMNATALFETGKLTVWCGTQAPVGVRDLCAEAVGLETKNVEVVTTYLGGGFGRRVEPDFPVYAAKLALQMPGQPVQLVWSREEDMTHDFYRPGAIAKFRGRVKDGRASMIDGRIAAQSCDFQFMERVGAPTGGTDKLLVDGAVDQPYDIPNYRIRGYVADLQVPVGFWRAVGYSVNGFMHDTFVDELAHKAGVDPLDFRFQMIKDRHAPSAGTLERVRDLSGWTGPTPDGVGMGVGFTYSFGTSVAVVVRVEERDGAIHMTNAWIACDVGTALDPGIIKAQMISGLVYGLSAAAFEEITFSGGRVEQRNFPDYEMLRMHTMPVTEVAILETNPHLGGVGEPATPPAMPALGNALFDLTGRRARSLPLNKHFDLAM